MTGAVAYTWVCEVVVQTKFLWVQGWGGGGCCALIAAGIGIGVCVVCLFPGDSPVKNLPTM